MTPAQTPVVPGKGKEQQQVTAVAITSPPLFREHADITSAFSKLDANLISVAGPVIKGLDSSMNLAGNYTAGSVEIRLSDSSAAFAMGNINIKWKNAAGLERTAALRFSNSSGPNLMEVMAESPTHRTKFPLDQLLKVGQFLTDPGQFSDANPEMVTALNHKRT